MSRLWCCYHLWIEGSVLDFSVSAIGFCLFSLLFLNSLGNRTLVHGTGRWSRRCTLPALVNCSWTPHRAEKMLPLKIFSPFSDLFYLENDNPPSFVSCSQQFPVLVELNTRYDISWKKIRVGFWVRFTAMPGLPSVTLSSSVPFTCEKHHWMSLLPGKRKDLSASSLQYHVWKGYPRWKYFLSQIHSLCPCLRLTRHISAFLLNASLRSDLQEMGREN